MIPVLLFAVGLVLAPALAAQEIPNPGFEAQGGWLVNCAQAPSPPSYAPSQGRGGSRGFRLGRNQLADGCQGMLSQAFTCQGPVAGYTTVVFYAKFIQGDAEIARFHMTSEADPQRKALLDISPAGDFMRYSFSIEGCTQKAWVEFTVVEESFTPPPMPLIESTLIIDDVSCQCTSQSQISWTDEYMTMVIFGTSFRPPEAGRAGWRYPELLFRRGDTLGEGALGLEDVIFTLNHLFPATSTPPCLDAADFNDDGRVDVSDAVGTLFHLFAGAPPPPAPGPAVCAPDPSPDTLDCLDPPACR